MRQLGELKKQEQAFKAANAEVIAVFREEQKGVEGLKIIKNRQKVEFTLALDTGKAKTPGYSSRRGEFSSYVIDKDGVVQQIIKGDLRQRAKSQQLLATLKKITAESGQKGSDNKNKGSGRKKD